MIPEKLFLKHNNSEEYINIVEKLYEKVKDESLINTFSSPFVLFCGTLLEYLLNDLLIDYCADFFPENEQRRYAESFMSMGFKAKLTSILPIITGNKLRINTNSFEYKKLCEIITKRNQIAHGKDFFQGIEPDIIDDKSFTIPLTKMKNQNFLSFNLVDCKNYMLAINNFHKELYEAKINKKLTTNKFIFEITIRIRKTKILKT